MTYYPSNFQPPVFAFQAHVFCFPFSANTKHRLTLFYLCNDIVQTCKRKHAIVYKDAFKEILKEAVVHVR